jgi:HlyD family secretion protein
MRFRYQVVVALGLLALLLFFFLGKSDPVVVSVAAVEPGVVESTVSNTRAGTVKACLRAHLSPSIGGQIAVLNVREGDEVEEGALLLELWNRDLVAQVDFSKRELKAAKARAEASCLNADVAQRESDRLHRLKDSGAASDEQLDKVRTQASAMAAECSASQLQLDVSETSIELAEAQLEKTRLYAPFKGTIAELNGELNEFVTPSPPGIATPPVIDLVDNSCFYISAPIDEVDVARVRPGLPARVMLDAYGKREFAAKVRRVGSYVIDLEKQARTVDVEVEFDNPKVLKCVLAGYSADVEIILDVHENVLRIPTEAVIEGNRVFLLDESTGLIEQRDIEIGMENWDYTEVLSGLEEGVLVVTSVGKEGVGDGAAAVREAEQ